MLGRSQPGGEGAQPFRADRPGPEEADHHPGGHRNHGQGQEDLGRHGVAGDEQPCDQQQHLVGRERHGHTQLVDEEKRAEEDGRDGAVQPGEKFHVVRPGYAPVPPPPSGS